MKFGPSPASRLRPLRLSIVGTTLAFLALAAVCVAVFVSARASSDVFDSDPPLEVADVVADPAAWQGRRIQLSGQVAGLRAPFFLLGPERLPVYATPAGLDPHITDNDALDAWGHIERFDPKAFARRFDESFAAVSDLSGRYVLVADRILPSVPEDGTAGGPGD